jgi:hypothetical protein
METTATQNEQSTQDQQTSQTVTETETAPKKRSRSFAVQLLEADLLVAGITNNLDTLTAMGLQPDFLQSLEAAVQETRSVNEEQEKFKASLRESTTRLNDKLKDMARVVRFGQQFVKLHIPQALWLEFGMKQKR